MLLLIYVIPHCAHISGTFATSMLWSQIYDRRETFLLLDHPSLLQISLLFGTKYQNANAQLRNKCPAPNTIWYNLHNSSKTNHAMWIRVHNIFETKPPTLHNTYAVPLHFRRNNVENHNTYSVNVSCPEPEVDWWIGVSKLQIWIFLPNSYLRPSDTELRSTGYYLTTTTFPCTERATKHISSARFLTPIVSWWMEGNLTDSGI